LNKLADLHIDGTDIDSGLEYLPESLTRLYCYSYKENNTDSEKIRKELEKYDGQLYG